MKSYIIKINKRLILPLPEDILQRFDDIIYVIPVPNSYLRFMTKQEYDNLREQLNNSYESNESSKYILAYALACWVDKDKIHFPKEIIAFIAHNGENEFVLIEENCEIRMYERKAVESLIHELVD